MLLKFALPSLFTMALTLPAHALIQFSAREKAEHQNQQKLILETAAACADRDYNAQIAFHNKYKVSKFYGDQRADYKRASQRVQIMTAKGYSQGEAEEIAAQQEATACITMTRKCLREGFTKAGPLSQATWEKIDTYLRGHGVLGTDLQVALQDLGWKIYYWNPATSTDQMAAWDADDRARAPLRPEDVAAGRRKRSIWGDHLANYKNVKTNGIYFRYKVDNSTTLVGFGDRPPASFARIPFFVGIANVGYHVFPGRRGEVIEAHSKRDLFSIDNLQFSPFNPLGTGGGPRWTPNEKYRSGLIAVPYDF